jgi:N-acyl homoserine lactone hydrolase
VTRRGRVLRHVLPRRPGRTARLRPAPRTSPLTGAGYGRVKFATVARDHDIRDYAFEGPAYLGFPASHDFYGDGSVVIVPAAGHTTGSVIVFVTLPSAKRYAFIGDLTWQSDGITGRREKPLMMRMLADSDTRQVRQDMARIIAIKERMQVVPAHDRGSYDDIPLLAMSKAASK